MSGSTNTKLTKDICGYLGTSPANMDVTRFSDGEVTCMINESIRGKDVFCVQSCAPPVNDSVVELLLTVTALRRSGANTITAVIPYFGYKFHTKRGLPISTTYESRFLWNAAGDVAKMLQVVGVDKVVSVDLQRPGQGHEACFFDSSVPVETISTEGLFVDYFSETLDFSRPVVIVSPSTEYVKKAKKFQKKLSKRAGPGKKVAFSAYVDTAPPDQPEALLRKPSGTDDTAQLYGHSVKGASVVIIDDVVDTSGSLPLLTRRLKKEGAAKVYICATHGVFTEKSMEVRALPFLSFPFTSSLYLSYHSLYLSLYLISLSLLSLSAPLRPLCPLCPNPQIIDLMPVEKVVVTDSLPLPSTSPSPKLVQLSVAALVARIIEAEMRNNQGAFGLVADQGADHEDEEETFEEEK